jgi:DNA-binding XRE family transcriptional regulator
MASGEIIGKYELNENSPSLETAFKMAKVFRLKVDILLGEVERSFYDMDTIDRIKVSRKWILSLNLYYLM